MKEIIGGAQKLRDCLVIDREIAIGPLDVSSLAFVEVLKMSLQVTSLTQ